MFFGENMGRNGPQFRATRGLIQARSSPAVARCAKGEQPLRGQSPASDPGARNKVRVRSGVTGVVHCSSRLSVNFRTSRPARLYRANAMAMIDDLAVETRRAPERIGDAYLADQCRISIGTAGRRSAQRPPAPIEFENLDASAGPSQIGRLPARCECSGTTGRSNPAPVCHRRERRSLRPQVQQHVDLLPEAGPLLPGWLATGTDQPAIQGPGAERKLTGKEEALLVATACANRPKGRSRWTLKLLARAIVKLHLHNSLSHETVRRRLA